MDVPPRPGSQRRRDTERRLEHDVDLWVASASTDGLPHLIPLSFDWDGTALLLSTPRDSPTGRNLAATRTARLGLGETRDVTLIEGDVEVLAIDALPPRRIQAWREVDELAERELMRDGEWTTAS